MINGVYQLGKLSLIDKDINDDLSIIIENPNIDGNYPKVLVINFGEKNDKIEYKDISLEEFSKNKIKKYAYRFGSSSGGNLTPCMKLIRAKNDYEKNYKRNIKNFIKPFKYLIERSEEEKFSNIKDELIKKQEEIIEKFKSFLDVDNSLLLTIKINEKYIGEYETVLQVLKERYYNSYYKKHNTESRSAEKRCYICRNVKDEVFGFVNTYNFYTLDKKGFVTGGFDHKDAWKIYPVCRECSLILESGRTYIENKLKSKFAGLDFFIIPKSILPVDEEEALKEYKNLIEKLFEKNNISLSNDKRREIMFNENISFYTLSEMKNSLLYDIVFYNKSNAEYKILMLIEDVFPSRLKKLFDYKKESEDFDIFKNLKSKKETYDMKFNFSILKNFFPANKVEGNWNKDFLNAMYSIFIGEKINYQFIIDSYMRKIRPKFVKEENINLDCLKSLLLLKFLINSKLIENGGEPMTEETENYFSFLNEHKKVINTVEKKGIFLLGVLVNKFLYIQYQDRNSKPFYGRLNGLKINEDIAKRIFPEVVNKLNEYNKNFFPKLEKRISELFVESDFEELSNNEISYYFVLGMNLSNYFKNEKNEENGEDKSDE